MIHTRCQYPKSQKRFSAPPDVLIQPGKAPERVYFIIEALFGDARLRAFAASSLFSGIAECLAHKRQREWSIVAARTQPYEAFFRALVYSPHSLDLLRFLHMVRLVDAELIDPERFAWRRTRPVSLLLALCKSQPYVAVCFQAGPVVVSVG